MICCYRNAKLGSEDAAVVGPSLITGLQPEVSVVRSLQLPLGSE